MKKLFILSAVLIALVNNPLAQGTPEHTFSAFTGFQYTRIPDAEANLFGWNLALGGHLRPWFAIVGDLSGGYGDVTGIGMNTHTFTVGPQFTVHRSGGSAFLRVLAGGVRSSAFGFSDTDVAFLLGGGADVHLSGRMSIRIVQVDYLRMGAGDGANSFRIAAGPMFRF